MAARVAACAGAAAALILPMAMTSNVLAAGASCRVSDQNAHKSYSSFPSAVAAAKTGDTLVVSGTCSSTTETIINGLVLTIKGKKGTNPTIRLAKGSTGRVLGVFPSTKVTIDHLTITGGHGAEGGGGLDNFGTVTLNHVKVTHNSVTATMAASVAGGILNEEGATLTLDASSVTDNSATASTGQQALGGGIFDSSGGTTATRGTVKLRDSTVSGNTAGEAPTKGGTQADYGFGGGIYVSGTAGGSVGARVTLTGTTSVTGNTATGTEGADGGGVFVDTGGDFSAASTVNISGNIPDNVYPG